MVVFTVLNHNSFLDKVELRKAQGLASEARGQAQMKTKIADAKKKYVSLVCLPVRLPQCSEIMLPENIPPKQQQQQQQQELTTTSQLEVGHPGISQRPVRSQP